MNVDVNILMKRQDLRWDLVRDMYMKFIFVNIMKGLELDMDKNFNVYLLYSIF